MHAPVNTPVQSVHIIQAQPRLYLTDWLSGQNHWENKDEEISSMYLHQHDRGMYYILECMSIQEIWDATQEDDYLQALTAYLINVLLMTKAEVKHETQPSWTQPSKTRWSCTKC